jgi:hypothetical protein
MLKLAHGGWGYDPSIASQLNILQAAYKKKKSHLEPRSFSFLPKEKLSREY